MSMCKDHLRDTAMGVYFCTYICISVLMCEVYCQLFIHLRHSVENSFILVWAWLLICFILSFCDTAHRPLTAEDIIHYTQCLSLEPQGEQLTGQDRKFCDLHMKPDRLLVSCTQLSKARKKWQEPATSFPINTLDASSQFWQSKVKWRLGR